MTRTILLLFAVAALVAWAVLRRRPDESWAASEARADADIAAGRARWFTNVTEAIGWLLGREPVPSADLYRESDDGIQPPDPGLRWARPYPVEIDALLAARRKEATRDR